MFANIPSALVALDSPHSHSHDLFSRMERAALSAHSASGPIDDASLSSHFFAHYRPGDSFSSPEQFDLSSFLTDAWRGARRSVDELVVIDSGVDNWRQLAADIQRQQQAGRSIDYVILDSASDGVDQITQALQGYRSVSALHIVSHGADGALMLGNEWLTLNNVAEHSTDLLSWRDALKRRRRHSDVRVRPCCWPRWQGISGGGRIVDRRGCRRQRRSDGRDDFRCQLGFRVSFRHGGSSSRVQCVDSN